MDWEPSILHLTLGGAVEDSTTVCGLMQATLSRKGGAMQLEDD